MLLMKHLHTDNEYFVKNMALHMVKEQEEILYKHSAVEQMNSVFSD